MMETQTSYAGVLIEAQTAFEQSQRQLEEALRSPWGWDATELADCLATVRDDLVDHFRFEEESGYMDPVLMREPRLDRPVQNLLADHRRLRRALDALIDEAKSCRTLSASFRAKMRAWVEAVRAHEIRENALLEEAFNLDIGAED
jgi:hypothetical protein